MPPGCHREISCLPTQFPNSLTLCGLPQHKLNIKLAAPVMLLCGTCRPSVWPHRLHRHVIRGADTSQHALHVVNIHAMSYYFPAFHCHRRTLALCHELDNLCLTNINSPSSKFNAKLQLAVHERGIAILILGESSRVVHHCPALSRRLSRCRSAGRTGNA